MVVLEKFAPGFEDLKPRDLKASGDFAFLWTLFEAQVLDTNASARKIKTKSVEWLAEGLLNDHFWVNHLNYFKDRYIENGVTNYRFDALNLRAGDDPELIRQVLLGNNQNLDDSLAACLIIVLRFRNNFFHGLKWAYGMKEQHQNFETSIGLMSLCLDRFVQPN
ncbi:hypothetical protein MD588_23410 [Photobacterium sp. SDRW27]|uniref:hypothetical protein n=1 Tax=Photobacterium obscurum TaxID=2829490 RepID=UPI0022447EE4|nr:hypothetical protein [Photobacterium obscurum]MCW8331753.1 hypothetical protein [Photobacterium obscurum]